ncbi:uncharacterized protein LOC129582960 [Paramacrobiotus metropolitanus]|uniref:uncharacterized protein LOC129582960 n=1 Tax=Paramacrobiotus metropolitanus TaxID=2943436 RepID=UPI002445E6D0|nr:uncharacterized protein LOC129582960 [Paramacrobiotus metropolitanus]
MAFFVCGLLILTVVVHSFNISNGFRLLDEYCGSTLSLYSCDKNYSVSVNDSRQLSFFNVSAFQRCAVTLELNACSDTPTALYFNIQEANIASSASVEIWQMDPVPSALVLLKRIPGGRSSGNVSPRSVDQFLTSMTSRPRVLLVYQTAEYDRKYQVTLTWSTVYNDTPSDDGPARVFCPALKGYVDRDLMCGQMETVVCPSQFDANVNIPNAVKAMDLRECNDKDETQVVFEECFNTSTLNASKWNIADYLDERDSVNVTPENAQIISGRLALYIRNNEGKVTVARLNTTGKFRFRYGDVEIRAKLPRAPHLISWSSFSLLRADCDAYCEESIEILNARSDFPRRTDASLFIPSPWKPLAEAVSHDDDMSDDFHVYGLSWTEKAVIWYVDQKEVFRVEVTDTPHFPRYFAELAIYTSAVNQTGTSATELSIDYIVVRQRKSDAIEFLPVLSATTGVPPWVWTSAAGCLGLVGLVLVILGAVCLVKRRRSAGINRLLFSTALVPGNLEVVYENTVCGKMWKPITNVPEIAKSDLHFDKGILGSGEYGLVRKAVATKLIGFGKAVVVAVKSVKDVSDPHQYRLLTEELTLHAKIGRHLNIVNLLGAVMTDDLLLVLEFCRFGSLLSYLRNSVFAAQPKFPSTAYVNPVYLEMRSSKEKSLGKNQLTDEQLTGFAYQICRGMEYLSQHSIIHRDLAARNVLVADEGVVKICDFGLAKQKADYYAMSNTTVALPLRWMAPECLRTKVFSEKTDVWAFGVTLWEVFSLGAAPFADGEASQWDVQEFVEALCRGFQLKQPTICPSSKYEIMQLCWNLEPVQRPSFKALCLEISPLLKPETKSTYLLLDAPYTNYNVLYHNDGIQTYKVS